MEVFKRCSSSLRILAGPSIVVMPVGRNGFGNSSVTAPAGVQEIGERCVGGVRVNGRQDTKGSGQLHVVEPWFERPSCGRLQVLLQGIPQRWSPRFRSCLHTIAQRIVASCQLLAALSDGRLVVANLKAAHERVDKVNVHANSIIGKARAGEVAPKRGEMLLGAVGQRQGARLKLAQATMQIGRVGGCWQGLISQGVNERKTGIDLLGATTAALWKQGVAAAQASGLEAVLGVWVQRAAERAGVKAGHEVDADACNRLLHLVQHARSVL